MLDMNILMKEKLIKRSLGSVKTSKQKKRKELLLLKLKRHK